MNRFAALLDRLASQHDGVVCVALFELPYQPRLADTRLASEQHQRRPEAQRAARVEATEVQPARGLVFAHQQQRDQEAGEREERRDAQEAARETAVVEREHGHDRGDRAGSVLPVHLRTLPVRAVA